jgi:hypothetical protein
MTTANPRSACASGAAACCCHCFAGCSASEVLRALQKGRLIDPAAAGAPIEQAARPVSSSASALRLWAAARRIFGTPAASYLAGRCIRADSAELRYHPRTPHGPHPFTRYRAALIAAVREESGVVAVHRTFIDVKGESLAALAEPRCGLGRFGGGAVRLGGIAPVLGLAEGIETALSATALFGIPCWATLGTERFRLVALPPEVTGLVLFLDNDAGGRRAEALAREALGHRPIDVRYPHRPGADWNDVLRSSGQGGRGREERVRPEPTLSGDGAAQGRRHAMASRPSPTDFRLPPP